jgi:hypothetical protein
MRCALVTCPFRIMSMTCILLTSHRLEARPLVNYAPEAFTKASPPVRTNWSVLFRFAELDPAHFSPAEPVTVPPSAFDARAAWTGTFSESRPEQVRLEAAWWEGKPVYFAITGDWPSRKSAQELN